MRPMTILQALSETRPEYLAATHQTNTGDKLRYRKVLLGSILMMAAGITIILVCKVKNSQGNLTL